MAEEEMKYDRMPEAEEIINALCIKYADVLWAVRPGQVAVLGITNKERTSSNNTLAKCVTIRGINRQVCKLYEVPVRWVLELYCADWQKWSHEMRQWLLFHELLHIAPEEGKSVKHDIEDFAIILDAVGILWQDAKDLPNLLREDVKFNLDLRPTLPDPAE